MMNRKEFVMAVAKETGRKPATVQQCIYSHGFPAFEVRAGVGKYKHLLQPYYHDNQVKGLVKLVMRETKERA